MGHEDRVEDAATALPLVLSSCLTAVTTTRLWWRIGLIGFGGPAGQIALMHRLLVDERRWIGEARFLNALNFCMLLPGPEAQQLAIYIGWALHGIRGGVVAGTLFVLPGAVIVLGLSAIYALYGGVPLVAALFYGIKAAVLAVVVDAVIRIGKRALRNGWMLAIAAAAFVALFAFAVPFPLVVLAAALVGLVGGRVAPDRFATRQHGGDGPAGAVDRALAAREAPGAGGRQAVTVTLVCLVLWLAPTLALAATLGWDATFTRIGTFFSQMGVVTFGGAYAALAWVAQAAVETHGWLAPGEMLDGLGLAETTPGPLILVLQFVGFLAAFRDGGGLDPLLAGMLGAALTTWVTFLPSFLFVLAGAPFVERLSRFRVLGAALSAITAAVVGVILNLALWFALHVLFARVDDVAIGLLRLSLPDLATLDPAALVLSLAAFVALLRFKLGLVPVLAAAALLGMAWKLL